MRYHFRALQTVFSKLLLITGLIMTSMVSAQEEAVIPAIQTIICNHPSGARQAFPQQMILRVDLTTGVRSVISADTCDDWFASVQDPVLRDRGWGQIVGLAIESTGNIVALANANRYNAFFGGGIPVVSAVYRIDTITGARKLLSNFSDLSQGPGPTVGLDIAVNNSGHILVSGSGTLYSIDPSNGNRTILSDSLQSSQGAQGGFQSFGIAPPSGRIFVAGSLVDNSQKIADIFSVDPSTGSRSPLSNYQDAAQGATGTNLCGNNPVAVDSTGQVFNIFFPTINTGSQCGLFKVDSSNGSRILLSDFGNSQKGPVLDSPLAMKVANAGTILVTDLSPGNFIGGALIAIDPNTGIRTVISDFSNLAQGPGTQFESIQSSGIGETGALAVGTIPASIPSTPPVAATPISVAGGAGVGSTAMSPILTFAASSSSVQVGQQIVYTLTFTNNGSFKASKIVLSGKLSQTAKLKSIRTTPRASCKREAMLVCNFRDIKPGGAISVNITALAKKAGSVKNNVVLKYATPIKKGSTKLKTLTLKAAVQTTVTP